jgi:hypothetical protein
LVKLKDLQDVTVLKIWWLSTHIVLLLFHLVVRAQWSPSVTSLMKYFVLFLETWHRHYTSCWSFTRKNQTCIILQERIKHVSPSCLRSHCPKDKVNKPTSRRLLGRATYGDSIVRSGVVCYRSQ